MTVNFNYYRLFAILGCHLCLEGCLGQAFFHDENDPLHGQFGTLHSVPDRPPLPNFKNYDRIKYDLQHQTAGKKISS